AFGHQWAGIAKMSGMARSVLIAFLLVCVFTQDVDAQPTDTTARDSVRHDKPEVQTNGFMDVLNNGQVNASARFLRIMVGEPGMFYVPLSIYSGVSANNFQNTTAAAQRNNDHLVNNFINPLSGLVNISLEGILFRKGRSKRTTRAGFCYQIGERLLTGVRSIPANSPPGRPVNFLNAFGAAGLYFQTGAWESGTQYNIGIFWFSVRAIACYTAPSQLRQFISHDNPNGFYSGYSVGSGIDINRLVNLKLLLYNYDKAPEIDFALPIYLFSFNYSLKN
ncbi:MAG TPA: hypothetical protein VFZ78_05540, partial [Flavisolibacter sp.]